MANPLIEKYECFLLLATERRDSLEKLLKQTNSRIVKHQYTLYNTQVTLYTEFLKDLREQSL